MARLNGICEPPAKITEDVPYVLRPLRIAILELEPWENLFELLVCWQQRQTIRQIEAPIAECKQLVAEHVQTPQHDELGRTALKDWADVLLPVHGKNVSKRGRTVVQPVVCELMPGRALPSRELSRREPQLLGQVRVQDIAITRFA
jgi:hypothetical protein